MDQMLYKPGIVAPAEIDEPCLWFAFRGTRLLVGLDQGDVILPFMEDLSELGISPVRSQYLGAYDGSPCFSAELAEDTTAPQGMDFMDLRRLSRMVNDEIFVLAGRALQIVSWDQTHQFCGRCGAETETAKDERAKICPHCSHSCYPRLSPAIIVAIVNDGKILLARSERFPPGMSSVLAGFVEPGESFEECVKREVFEEVGIDVKNVQYFASQPWPFPNSLMVGFVCEYDGGEINVDGVEIVEAGWFTPQDLPMIPDRISIARRLIDWFVEENR